MPRHLDNARTAPDGEYWGQYTATSALPGTAAGVPAQTLTVGDIASVSGELYICTSAAPLAATWKKVARDGGSVDALTVAALTVSGAATVTGGIVGTTNTRISNIPIGAVALASLGTNTTPVSGTQYFAEIMLPSNKTITGVAILNGGTVGTDKAIAFLCSSAGVVLATSALAGATTSGANTFQEYALTAPYAAVGPARYWIGVQVNGTTTRLRTIATATYLNSTGSAEGVFATVPAITPTATTTADVGPIGYVYT